MQTYRRGQGFPRKGTLATVARGTRSVAGGPGGMPTVSAILQKRHRRNSLLTSFPPGVPDLTRDLCRESSLLTNRSCESRGEITRLAASEEDCVAVG